MSKIGEDIKAIIQEHAPDYDLFLVGYNFAPGSILLQYFMDSEDQMPMQRLIKFTRHINAIVDELDLGTKKYNLEISSPGADKPLVDLRQIPKHIGKTLQLTVQDQVIEGEFIEWQNNQFTLNKKVFKTPNSRNFTLETVHIDWESINEIKIKLAY